MKLCSRLFYLLRLRRYKAKRVKFLLSVIELLFPSLTVEALQGKTRQNSLPSGDGRSLGAKISGGRGRPWEYFLVSTKLDTFCYLTCKLHRAMCRRFDTIPACDGRTDGIAIANTALAMRALRRAVKSHRQRQKKEPYAIHCVR